MSIVLLLRWVVIFDGFVKSQKRPFLSLRRKPESRNNKEFWTPAFAGVTTLVTLYENLVFEFWTSESEIR